MEHTSGVGQPRLPPSPAGVRAQVQGCVSGAFTLGLCWEAGGLDWDPGDVRGGGCHVVAPHLKPTGLVSLKPVPRLREAGAALSLHLHLPDSSLNGTWAERSQELTSLTSLGALLPAAVLTGVFETHMKCPQ